MSEAKWEDRFIDADQTITRFAAIIVLPFTFIGGTTRSLNLVDIFHSQLAILVHTTTSLLICGDLRAKRRIASHRGLLR